MHFVDTLNEESVSPDIKSLIRRIDTLDTIIHAQWLMLQAKGFTHEEFNAAIDAAQQRDKFSNAPAKGMCCPNCGKMAQLSGNFKIKCIYCGNEALINPYELMEMAMGQPVPSAPAAPVRDPSAYIQDPYVPYDVSQDLNFDDLM